MSLKTAVTLSLVGAALSVVLELGFLLGGEAYIEFMYRDNVAVGRILSLLPTLTLLIFFVVLRIKQK